MGMQVQARDTPRKCEGAISPICDGIELITRQNCYKIYPERIDSLAPRESFVGIISPQRAGAITVLQSDAYHANFYKDNPHPFLRARQDLGYYTYCSHITSLWKPRIPLVTQPPTRLTTKSRLQHASCRP